MTKIKPFRAVRPTRDKVHLVISRSLNTYTAEDLELKLTKNPYSFVHVLLPDYLEEEPSKANTSERNFKSRQKYEEFCKNRVFQQDRVPAFYIYQQTKHNESSRGFIAAISVEDHQNGHIKVHEETLTAREEKFKDYLKICRINAEPVLLTYPDDLSIDLVMDRYMIERPEYEFSTADKTLHKLWVIDRIEDIRLVTNAFNNIDDLYIADGHHRTASSALLSRELASEDERCDHFMAYFVPESELRIYDFNRVIRDLNGLELKEFLVVIAQKFSISEVPGDVFKPEEEHTFGMYCEGKWFKLEFKGDLKGLRENGPAADLDAQILSSLILEPILSIGDLKTDDRVDFVDGVRGMPALMKKVDSGKYKVAFALFPVSVERLKKLADAGGIMPPKSTWIEPKLRSGLTIYAFDDI